MSQGGAFGGFSLYLKEGKPAYCYNLFGLEQFKVYGEMAIPEGEHQVRMEFAYDGGGIGKGGTISLFVDGDQVGEGRVTATVPMFSPPMRPPMWRATAPHRLATTTGRRTVISLDGLLGADRRRRGRRGCRSPDRA